MNLNTMQGRANPAVSNIELVVEEENSTSLAVRAGSFRVSGEVYTFDEDQIYELVNDPLVRVWVTGLLVREKESGIPLLFIDEVYDDGEDSPYVFSKDSPYEVMNPIFVFEIPPHGGTLTDLEVTTFQVVPTQTEP